MVANVAQPELFKIDVLFLTTSGACRSAQATDAAACQSYHRS
jgi:hypothetical protein